MTRRMTSATLPSNSSSSRVSDVSVATSRRKSSKSLRSRNRTAGLTRDAAMSGLFHFPRASWSFHLARARRLFDDADAGTGADTGRAGGNHGLQVRERPDAP